MSSFCWPCCDRQRLSFLETASNRSLRNWEIRRVREAAEFLTAFNPLGWNYWGLIGTIFIFSGVELTAAGSAASKSRASMSYLRTETLRSGQAPTWCIGVIALIWAFLILRTKFPAFRRSTKTAKAITGRFQISSISSFLLAVVAQFLYVGAQVGTWSYFIQYVQGQYAHQPEKVAEYFLTGTLQPSEWKICLGLPDALVAPNKLMAAYSAANIALVALSVLMRFG